MGGRSCQGIRPSAQVIVAGGLGGASCCRGPAPAARNHRNHRNHLSSGAANSEVTFLVSTSNVAVSANACSLRLNSLSNSRIRF